MAGPGAITPRKNWWGRNWKWAVPVGIGVPVLACGGFVALVITLVFGMIKSSDPYRESLQAVQESVQMQTALGTPINAGWLVSGQINLQNSDGHADITYWVSGPRGSATVRVVGEKRAGVWSYSELDATLKADGRRIELGIAWPPKPTGRW